MLSIPRIFHVPDVDDPGFSLLTGGTTAPSRSTIWGWMGCLAASAMKKFRTLTEPTGGLAGQELLLSLDPHSVPCFTRKFAISKAYHTIRNKYMKLEQLIYFFDLARNTLLSLTVTPAAEQLHQVMRSLVAGIVERTRAAMVRIVLDAAALKGEPELLALMNTPRVQVLARAVRSQKYMKQWRAIPEGRWTRHEEPDETKGRPPCVTEIANTTTRIGPDRTPVRTIVAREYHGRNRKECYHVLYTNVAREHACSLVNEFRQRQRHEQAYRIGVHDLNLDALTHGYEKDSDPEAPTFDEARIGLVAWIKALAFNALRAIQVGPARAFLANDGGQPDPTVHSPPRQALRDRRRVHRRDRPAPRARGARGLRREAERRAGPHPLARRPPPPDRPRRRAGQESRNPSCVRSFTKLHLVLVLHQPWICGHGLLIRAPSLMSNDEQ